MKTTRPAWARNRNPFICSGQAHTNLLVGRDRPVVAVVHGMHDQRFYHRHGDPKPALVLRRRIFDLARSGFYSADQVLGRYENGKMDVADLHSPLPRGWPPG